MLAGICGQTRNLDNRTLGPADLTKPGWVVPAGPGTQIWGQTRNLGDRTLEPTGPDQSASRTVPAVPVAQIWGQTRCPVYRSGTFNVKRSTLKFQRGDRKGAWQAGYGDRHGIWTTGLLPQRTCPSTGRVVQAGCDAQIWGQTRCPVYRSGTFNVKRSTLKF